MMSEPNFKLSKDLTGTNITTATKSGYGTVHKIYGHTNEDGSCVAEDGTVEIISKNGEQQESKAIETKPLCILKDANDNIIAQDYIDLDKQKIHKECKYSIFNGSENWEIKSYNGKYYFRLSDTNVQASDIGMCNRLTFIESTKSIVENLNSIRCTAGAIDISLDFSDLSIDNFKTWLKSNNVVLINKLSGAIEEDILCSNKIKQFANSTIIYERSGAVLDVTLTNNKAIAEVNESLQNVQKKNIEQKEKLNNMYNEILANGRGYCGTAGAGANANDLKTIGLYRVNGNGTEKNFPTQANGIMEISGNAQIAVEQIFTNFDGKKWSRICWYGSWKSWLSMN